MHSLISRHRCPWRLPRREKEATETEEIHRELYKRKRTKYAMNEKDIFREKDINEKRLPRSKPKCSFSIQTQKTVLSVSSTQRMLVHMDTQGERMQDKITRVQDNFQRVGQSRTQIMLEEEKINQLQDRDPCDSSPTLITVEIILIMVANFFCLLLVFRDDCKKQKKSENRESGGPKLAIKLVV